MIIFQIILVLVLVPIQYGVLGRIGMWHLVAPDLLLLSTWLFAWLGDRLTAVRYAIILGVAVSLINFQRFGIWLLMYLAIVWAIDYARGRFFEVSSVIEAVICLVAANIISLTVASLLAGEFNFLSWLINIIINATLGIMLYFFIASRFRLFQRWHGGRL